MKKLTNIAKDYLDAVEVLTEARTTFEREVAEWWTGVINDTVKPALSEISPSSLHIWDNQSKAGVCQWKLSERAPIYIVFTDPRFSERGCYTVTLKLASKTQLQETRKNSELVARLEKTANLHAVSGQEGMNWKTRELASVEIPIQPDDPEGTAEQVRDTAVRFFQVVLEHHKALEKAE